RVLFRSFAGLQNTAGVAAPKAFGALRLGDFGLPDFEQARLGLSGQPGEGAGPRDQAAHAIPDGASRLVPGDLAVLLFDSWSVTDAGGGLGARLDFAGDIIRNRADEQFRSHFCEPVVQ